MASNSALAQALYHTPLVAKTSDTPFAREAVEKILGHRFADSALLLAAFTHNSMGGDKHEKEFVRQHQRLEFLGDRVIGLAVAELLYQTYPQEDEGTLSIRFHNLVSGRALATMAEQLGLAQHLRYGGGIVQVSDSMLADCFEAAVGALHLDGGTGVATNFVHKVFGGQLTQDNESLQVANPKTRLQTWSLMHHSELPVYEVLELSGPDHAPSFRVQVSVGNHTAEGVGSARRDAEQQAAEKMLTLLADK